MLSYESIYDSIPENRGITKRTFLNFSNLIKSTMGIGICALSRMYVTTGIPLGIFILILMGVLSFWAQRAVLKYKEKYDLSSLEEVAEKALGSAGKWVIRIALAVNIYCSMICLFSFIGEFTFPLMRIMYPAAASVDSLFYKLLISCTSVAIFPLAMFKNLEFLGFSSAFGMACLLILMTTTILAAILEGSTMKEPRWIPESGVLAVITCLGNALMANHGQHAICDIHTDSKEKSSLTKASIASCTVVTLMNITLSLIVYIAFGDQQTTDPDALFVNFERSDKSAAYALAVGTSIYCLTIIVTLPLYNFYFRRMAWDSARDLRKPQGSEKDMPAWFRIGWSLIAWLSATAISVFAPNSMKVLDFSGLFSCTITMIILPTSLYLSEYWRNAQKLRMKHIVCVAMLFIGMFFIGISIRDLILTIQKK